MTGNDNELTLWSTNSICRGGFIFSLISSGSDFINWSLLGSTYRGMKCDRTKLVTYLGYPGQLHCEKTKLTHSHEGIVESLLEVFRFQVIVRIPERVLTHNVASKSTPCHFHIDRSTVLPEQSDVSTENLYLFSDDRLEIDNTSPGEVSIQSTSTEPMKVGM